MEPYERNLTFQIQYGFLHDLADCRFLIETQRRRAFRGQQPAHFGGGALLEADRDRAVAPPRTDGRRTAGEILFAAVRKSVLVVVMWPPPVLCK
jgi:hypothetical protein